MASKEDIAELIRRSQSPRTGGGLPPVPPDVADAIAAGLGLPSNENFTERFFGELAPGGADVRTRFALARADVFEEKLKAFEKLFPEGELHRTPVSGELIFRENKADSFRRVDPDEFEPIKDIVDFLGDDLGSIAGEIIGLVPNGQGLRIGQQAIRAFLGGTAGDLWQQVGEELAGENLEAAGDVGARSLLKGGLGAVGTFAGGALGGTSDAITGRAFFNVDDVGRRAQQSARDLGLNPLHPGQVATNPVVRRISGQASVLDGRIRAYETEQLRQLRAGFDSSEAMQNGANLRVALGTTHDNMINDALAPTRPVTQKTFAQAGESLEQSMFAYDRASQRLVTQAYNAGREIAEPRFSTETPITLGGNMTSLSDVARDVLAVPTAAGREGAEVAGSNLDPQVAALARRIINLDPNMPNVGPNGEQFQPFEVLKNMRTEAFDLKDPGLLEQRTATRHGPAARLHAALTETMRNPRNSNPEFLQMWAAASDQANKRFTTLEKFRNIQTAKGAAPEELALKLATPNSASNLKLIRRHIPVEKYQDMQDAFRTQLMDADDIGKRMDEFDKETLDQLMTPAEQDVFRQAADSVRLIESSGVQDAVNRQISGMNVMRDIMADASEAQGVQVVNTINAAGGPFSPTGKAARAGLYDLAADALFNRQGDITGKRVMEQFLQRLDRSGLRGILTTADNEFLGKVADVAPFLRPAADAGTSIQAGEVAANAMDLMTPGGKVDAGKSYFNRVIGAIGFGDLFLNPTMQKILLGRGKPPSEHRLLKAIAASASTASEDSLNSDRQLPAE